jgi:hypothetical protein
MLGAPFVLEVIKQDIYDIACQHFDFPIVRGNSYRSEGHQPAADRKEYEMKRKMCRLVIVECGLRLGRTRNGYL